MFLEAWASGTPVVTLQIDPDRIIEKQALGVISGGVEGTVKDINALLESPEKREAIGVHAKLHVVEAHSAKTASKTLENAIRYDDMPLLNVAEN